MVRKIKAAQDADREIGQRMRLCRMDRKVSQQHLGKALNVSFQQVQKYEKGTNRMSGGRLMQVATALKTSPHELMGWNGAGENFVLIDPDTYQLAKAFTDLRPEFKPIIRTLITALIRLC